MEDVEDDESSKQSVLLPLVMRSQGCQGFDPWPNI